MTIPSVPLNVLTSTNAGDQMTFEQQYAVAMQTEAEQVRNRFQKHCRSMNVGEEEPATSKAEIQKQAEAKRRKIIALAEQGFSQKQIKAELHIGSATIKRHLVAWRKENVSEG